MLILISGGSCSGKTTLAKELTRQIKIKGLNCYGISTDLFYKDLPMGISTKDYNFDTENSINKEQLLNVVKNYKVGIDSYNYFDFKTHSKSNNLVIPAVDVLIIEGIFAFSFPEILRQANLTIFIDTDKDTRYKRRYNFYSGVLKHSDEFINMKFYQQAEPYFANRISPLKDKSHMVISGNAPFYHHVEKIANNILKICSSRSMV